eukprot:9487421-Pyramimonas_sp.AAC.1
MEFLDVDLDSRIPAGPTPEQLKKISAGFKVNAAAVDGCDPKHFSQLSGGALEVMEGISIVMNTLGTSPLVLEELIVALFREIIGRRPIGFFKSYSRVYSKSPARHCRQWERVAAESSHSNVAPHRRTTDSAWRAVARTDLADRGRF